MTLIVDLQVAMAGLEPPALDWLTTWLGRCLPATSKGFELTLRLVDAQEMQFLNATYRGRDAVTNILSFTADVPDVVAAGMERQYLGDLVLCWPVVLQEAAAQHKSIEAHLAHLLVHGCLHLQGWDHQETEEAEGMEAEEIRVLQEGGIGNPYQYQGVE